MPELATNTDNIYVLLLIGIAGMFFLALAVVIFYIRNQHRMQKQLRERQEAELQHQKELTYAVIQSQDEERKRIGRDLHDDVGSTLSTLKLHAPDPAFRDQLDGIMGKVRNISHMLSPAELELFGLEDAVEELCRVIHQSGQVAVMFINEASEPMGQLAYERALSIYRVLQELFTNTIKHAGASQVTLSFLKEGNGLVCLYTDDGVGWKPGKGGGMGMRNIESRLGMIGAGFQIQDPGMPGFGIKMNIPIDL